MCPSDTCALPETLELDFDLRVTVEALTLLLLPLKLLKKSFASEVERIRRKAARGDGAAKRCFPLFFVLHLTSSFPLFSSASSSTSHPFLQAQLNLSPLFFPHCKTVTDIPKTTQSLSVFRCFFSVAAVQ